MECYISTCLSASQLGIWPHGSLGLTTSVLMSLYTCQYSSQIIKYLFKNLGNANGKIIVLHLGSNLKIGRLLMLKDEQKFEQ